MFTRWKRWNKWERICCITALVCLLLMPVWFVCIFILPSYTSFPIGKIALWLNRICMVMMFVMLGLADWRTDRKGSFFDFGMAGCILLGIILSEIF